MYTPHTDADREAMLETIGVEAVNDLFQCLPNEDLPDLALPEGITEMEALAELQYISSVNETTQELTSFLGAGAYNHYVPAAVDSLLRRGEFYTAYTPYQPEISQGTLQSIFEYQSLIAALTGMDISNASHYDGATAVAEAVNMALNRFRGRRLKFVLSPRLHPQARETVHTYMKGSDVEIVGEDLDPESDPEELISLIDEDTALVFVQYPDFFGQVYDYTELGEAAHDQGAMFGVHVNPIALGLLKPPSAFDADIVTGEGQPLGVPLSFGGPYLGIFATKKEFVRKMAGRLAGETVDDRGQRGYVLTLSTREQHIRRERATSNICTNQGLIMLASTIFLSLLGKEGLRELAALNYHKAHYAAEQINTIPGYLASPGKTFFNEFVVHCPRPAAEVNEILLQYDILGGYDLSESYPGMENALLMAVTEMIGRSEIEFMIDILAEETNA
ncbi:MAG: aminomethyl-transferring glycine dehydrogenase subunit GcvPA [Anaerolineales bacterium]|nr:aminomethyl-transferring glycine dehydrogenase subunit GcvPA [Anaerolineales bacterium]MBS3753387.1 aminomethyl-transferring glycine dehydrogenase subunit GcvPA [Anaerolineales bacterium]